MKSDAEQMQLTFDEVAPEPAAPRQQSLMFGIKGDDLAPILAVSRRLAPDADHTTIGDWGILFFICGARAGESLNWKATVMEHIRMPGPEEFMRFLLTGAPDNEHIGTQFSEVIKDWAGNETGLALARQRLQAFPNIMPKNMPRYEAYFTLAIMLNNMTGSDLDPFAQVESWAQKDAFHWQTLFFAAGLLLSNDKAIRWEIIESFMRGVQGGCKADVNDLFTHYTNKRQ